MSRSHKKPYCTDQNAGKPGYGFSKRTANKAVRLENKKAVQGDENAELSKGRSYRKTFCSYNIRDWSFYSPQDKKAHRK